MKGRPNRSFLLRAHSIRKPIQPLRKQNRLNLGENNFYLLQIHLNRELIHMDQRSVDMDPKLNHFDLENNHFDLDFLSFILEN